MKHLKTIKLTALTLMLLVSACHKEDTNEIELPYGVELITQPGDCICKQWKEFEKVDTAIYLFARVTGDTTPFRHPYSLVFFNDTLLVWAGVSFGQPFGPVCNPPEILKSIEIPVAGLKIKTSADFYRSCEPYHGELTANNIILTSFIIQKP